MRTSYDRFYSSASVNSLASKGFKSLPQKAEPFGDPFDFTSSGEVNSPCGKGFHPLYAAPAAGPPLRPVSSRLLQQRFCKLLGIKGFQIPPQKTESFGDPFDFTSSGEVNSPCGKGFHPLYAAPAAGLPCGPSHPACYSSASVNSLASKGFKSSMPSPTPTYLTGICSSWAMAMTMPPLAVPSSLVSTSPVIPAASLNCLA